MPAAVALVLALSVAAAVACEVTPAPVEPPPSYALADAEISGDFGPHTEIEGDADLQTYPGLQTINVRRTTEAGFVLSVLVSDMALPSLPAGIYANVWRMVRLCSGLEPGSFQYDRNADEVETEIVEIGSVRRFIVKTATVDSATSYVERTETSFSLVEE
jgi:hypothetical protein